MEQERVHELAAGYALDALDDDELSRFEAHLAGCEACTADLEAFRDTVQALAYAADGPPPPARLRARILDAARDEQPRASVVVLRPRRTVRLAALAAAACAAAAIGLGVWAATLSSSLDDERAARAAGERAAAVLADEDSRHRAFEQGGRVVVAESGEAVLVVPRLPDAPEGKTYEAWVVEDEQPLPAGLFEGDEPLVLLDRTVPDGAQVAVTLEPEGGSELPTGDILLASDEV
jgi:anti-sigma factor RsiW